MKILRGGKVFLKYVVVFFWGIALLIFFQCRKKEELVMVKMPVVVNSGVILPHISIKTNGNAPINSLTMYIPATISIKSANGKAIIHIDTEQAKHRHLANLKGGILKRIGRSTVRSLSSDVRPDVYIRGLEDHRRLRGRGYSGCGDPRTLCSGRTRGRVILS